MQALRRYRQVVVAAVVCLGLTGVLLHQTQLGQAWNGQVTPWDTDEVGVQAKGRVLVTGGGKQLVRRLLTSNTPVTVLDLIFHPDEIEGIHRDLPQADHLLKVMYGDIRDEQVLERAFTSDTIGVIHLAAVSRVGWCLDNEPDCEDVNVRGTDLVLGMMERKVNDGWFIQASSREVYGNAQVTPVTEDTPNEPANAYGSTKSAAEAVVRSHRSRAILLRLSNVYGGLRDHHERLIPAIITNALAHRPIQMLDMIHIDDVIDAFSLAVNRLEGRAGDLIEVFNVARGASSPAMGLVQKVLTLTNSSSPLQVIPGDDRYPDRYVGSTTRARDVLGFESRIDQDQGLVRLVSAYLGDTIDYLDAKISTDCAGRPAYTTHDLVKLDGCTGTVGYDGPTGMEYLQEAEGVFTWLDTDDPQTWRFEVKGDGRQAIVRFSNGIKHFEATEPGHLLGAQSRFIARVDSLTGYVRLSFAETSTPLVPHTDRPGRFRLTPMCCPGKSAPWPFFRQDPLASSISDQRLETMRYFNASQQTTICGRLDTARRVAQDKLARLPHRPFTIHPAPLPTGEPADWRLRGLDHCSNLCDHPTVCVDTGNCACALSSCASRLRFPFTAFANVPALSYPLPTVNWDDLELYDPDILIKQVDQSSWLNVLRPGARRWLQRSPSFPYINLTRLPDDIQQDRDDHPEDFNKVQSTSHGCFSADSVMERGVKALSQRYAPGDLVFMPYFAGTKMDVVIPSRTCLQDKLRERFGDLHRVKPCRQRSILVAFKGSQTGAGATLRHKVVCDRPYKHTASNLVEGNLLQRYWNELKGDYLETIGDTVFCPLPRGTTGWATRTIDVIYA
ncbi:hypothetical protein IAU60_006335 [Kwoniella sp. DSM 27419]